MYYGLSSHAQAFDLAHAVCDVLGYGSNGNAHLFTLEIAATETNLGLYRDPTDLAGMGLHQFDKKPFEYIQQTARKKHKKLILKHFGIEVDRVQWFELQHNPLLSFIWCRLFWLKREELIPTTLHERAALWKLLYNSSKGKGHVDHYIKKSQEYVNEKVINQRCPSCNKSQFSRL